MSKSVIERLWEVQPDAEIWWDSSPLIYENWRRKMIEQAADKDEMREWLARLFNDGTRWEDNLFRGVTTNPPLSCDVIQENPEYWSG